VRSIIVTALAAALVACTSGGTKPGDTCSSKAPCSGGQVCDLTNPGGAVCLDSAGDVDGDGIPNGKDFCNHLAGGAFDEDGDGFGDECDACPTSKPPTKPDADGDMVDSPCDPDSTTAGDKIAVFNGFNTALPTGWTASAGWKVTGGEAVMTPTNPATVEQLTVHLAVPSTHVSILAAYRVDSVAATAAMSDAGVIGQNVLPQGTTIVSCGANRATGDALRLVTNAGSNLKQAMNLFDPAGVYRLAQQLDGATVNCALVGDHETAADQASSNGDSMSEVGLYARGATVRFQYLLVIQR